MPERSPNSWGGLPLLRGRMMVGSYHFEFVIGLAILGVAALLWRYLLFAFRKQPVPLLLRSEMAAELSTVLEIALLAFGVAALIDAAVKAMA